MIDYDHILESLRNSWSIESSSRYCKNNPACGQCSVTSIVIQRKYGGKVLKTKVEGRWHFYNQIDNSVYDFTKEQFQKEIEYSNEASSIEEALTDCTIEQLEALWRLFSKRVERNE